MASKLRIRSGRCCLLVLMFFLVRVSGAIPTYDVCAQQITNTEELFAALKSATAADNSVEFDLLNRHHSFVTTILCLRLIQAGNNAKSQGELQLSITMYSLAKHSATLLKNRFLTADAAYLLAKTLLDQGRFADAVRFYIESRDIYREGEIPAYRVQLAVLLSELAFAEIRLRRYHNANKSLSECLELRSSLNGSSNQLFAESISYATAKYWSVLGEISLHDGHHEKALACLQKSFGLFDELAQKTPRYESLAINLIIDIADIYGAIGNFSESLDSFNRAIDRARKANHKSELQRALNLLGGLYIDTGDFASAAEFLKESLRIARDISNEAGIVATLVNLAVSAHRQGRYTEALAHCNEASALADPKQLGYLIPPLKQMLGLIHQVRGDYETASGYFEEALSLAETAGDLSRQSAVLWRKGELRYLKSDYSQALKLADASYRIASDTNIPLMSYLSLSLKGKALLAQRHYKPASEALTAAIELVEGMRSRLAGGEEQRAYFFQGGKIDAYHSIVDLLTVQNRSVEALIYSERAKARVLLDVLQRGKTNMNGAMTEEERGSERRLQEHLALLNTQVYAAKQAGSAGSSRVSELEAQLEKTRLEYASFRNKLYFSHPELRSRRGESQPISLGDLGSLVPDTDTALLEYVVADEKTTLFVITRSDEKNEVPDIRAIVIDVNIRSLTELVHTLREQLGNPHLLANKSAGHLYDLLVRPAERLTQGRSKLIIVPDRVLWELPFQALKHNSGSYFIENHSLLYAPSLAVLNEMYGRDEKPTSGVTGSGSLLALGNPDLAASVTNTAKAVRRNQGIQALPEAETEVKTIARLYGTTSKVFVGPAAREALAKSEMPKCDVLHFATHGLLDDGNPMYSRIVLSRDETDKEDGLLEAREIMALDLKARIAVLSACDTARGHVSAGEGVIGMSWAFFIAGCPTTVVSQWRVNSASTSQLMIEFHRNLLAGSSPTRSRWWKADAMRKAMLSLLKNPKYKDPYYWAGFVVIGAG